MSDLQSGHPVNYCDSETAFELDIRYLMTEGRRRGRDKKDRFRPDHPKFKRPDMPDMPDFPRRDIPDPSRSRRSRRGALSGKSLCIQFQDYSYENKPEKGVWQVTIPHLILHGSFSSGHSFLPFMGHRGGGDKKKAGSDVIPEFTLQNVLLSVSQSNLDIIDLSFSDVSISYKDDSEKQEDPEKNDEDPRARRMDRMRHFGRHVQMQFDGVFTRGDVDVKIAVVKDIVQQMIHGAVEHNRELQGMYPIVWRSIQAKKANEEENEL